MAKQLTIGEVAKRTGLSTKAIRFYEEEGCIPAVGRNDAGYRQYSEGDVWRLRLVKHIRLLGLPLAEVRSLVTESLNEECSVFAGDLTQVLSAQKDAISRRISELESLRDQIDVLQGHVEHCECDPGQTAAECYCCSLLTEEGGAPNG
jgi:DNA-binding transcriptional MerR regulator